MAMKLPDPALSRTKSKERDQSWPDTMAIVATWRQDNRTLTVTEEVTADQFFGNGDFGAPITGEFLVGAMERLRKAK